MNDTNLQTAVFNKLTKAQYEEKLNNNEINDNEFYMIVDANQMEFSNIESETGVTLKTIKIGNDIWKLPSTQNVSVDLSNYYTKAEVYNKDETYNRDEIDTLVGSGSGGGSVGDSITLSKVVSDVIETGSSADSYFQTQRMRGEGDANSYYHAIEYGYAGNDLIDWFEYGCQWNFWDGTTGQKDKSDDKRCLSIYKDYVMNKGNIFTWPEKSGTFALLSDLEGLGGGTPDLTGYATETWVNEQGFAKTEDVVTKEDFTEFIGAAPEAFNTIHEIAAALEGQDDTITAIETTIGQKANSDDVYTKTEIDMTVATLEGAIQVVESKIPNIVYSETEPESPVEGMIWLKPVE